MAHKTRWQHLPPRTHEFDLGAWVQRHNDALAKDRKLVVLVVKNVRPTQRGDCSAPFVLVGTRLRLLDGLYNEYGRGFVGEPVLVTAYEGMDVLQVCVMSALGRDEVKRLQSEMGYEGYANWKANLLMVERHLDEMPVVWYGHRVLDAQVPRLIERLYRAEEARVERDYERMMNTTSRVHGTCGRVPAVTYSVHDVTITR